MNSPFYFSEFPTFNMKGINFNRSFKLHIDS